MAYCSKCGTELLEGQTTCPNCNTPVGTAQSTSDDVKDNKVFAILAYLGILVLVPIFAAPNSEFARFHANQGLILLIAAIAISVLSSIISSIVWVLGFLVSLLSIVVFVFAIMGIINAAKGEMKELPLIGGIKLLK